MEERNLTVPQQLADFLVDENFITTWHREKLLIENTKFSWVSTNFWGISVLVG